MVGDTEAEISYLARNIMMAMNDIFCPNTHIHSGQTVPTYTVLDTANCSVGADGSLATRMSSLQEKDTEPLHAMEMDGKQFYVIQ